MKSNKDLVRGKELAELILPMFKCDGCYSVIAVYDGTNFEVLTLGAVGKIDKFAAKALAKIVFEADASKFDLEKKMMGIVLEEIPVSIAVFTTVSEVHKKFYRVGGILKQNNFSSKKAKK